MRRYIPHKPPYIILYLELLTLEFLEYLFFNVRNCVFADLKGVTFGFFAGVKYDKLMILEPPGQTFLGITWEVFVIQISKWSWWELRGWFHAAKSINLFEKVVMALQGTKLSIESFLVIFYHFCYFLPPTNSCKSCLNKRLETC